MQVSNITAYIERDIDIQLKKWISRPQREVLLMRGARQTGKSRSIRELGKDFDYYIEANLEEEPDLLSIFNSSRNPQNICDRLSAFYGMPIIPQKTLIFIDEIQESENALHSLRFFKEKMPDLHVVAAGSLLEFALAEMTSFGVGRISFLFLYPLNFGEFIQATHSKQLRNFLLKTNVNYPIDAANYQIIFETLRVYLAIGGLPEVVSLYKQTRDFNTCMAKLSSLALAYETDFSKYKTRINPDYIRAVFLSVSQQSGSKFVYSRVSDTDKTAPYKQALNLLVQAGLCYKVHHSSSSGFPIGAAIDPRKFKVIPFDVGIYQSLNNLNIAEHVVADYKHLLNAGATSEIFTGLELISYSSSFTPARLYYWHREARSSNAEIDYVVELGDDIVPIEVKSSGKGAMKSMYRFLDEKKSHYGLRVSHENFSEYDRIRVLPIVALEQLRTTLS